MKEKRIVFILGEGNREAGKKAREKYSDFKAVDGVYESLRDYWNKKIEKLQIHTPNQGMNTLINTWTLYQAENQCYVFKICVLYRSGMEEPDLATVIQHRMP